MSRLGDRGEADLLCGGIGVDQCLAVGCRGDDLGDLARHIVCRHPLKQLHWGLGRRSSDGDRGDWREKSRDEHYTEGDRHGSKGNKLDLCEHGLLQEWDFRFSLRLTVVPGGIFWV
jgi:hypothetical protein